MRESSHHDWGPCSKRDAAPSLSTSSKLEKTVYKIISLTQHWKETTNWKIFFFHRTSSSYWVDKFVFHYFYFRRIFQIWSIRNAQNSNGCRLKICNEFASHEFHLRISHVLTQKLEKWNCTPLAKGPQFYNRVLILTILLVILRGVSYESVSSLVHPAYLLVPKSKKWYGWGIIRLAERWVMNLEHGGLYFKM